MGLAFLFWVPCASLICVEVGCVRVLIQNCDTYEYFAGDAGWVREPERACAFPSGVDALQFIRQHVTENVQIVLNFAETRYDFEVAKTKGC
ncbi:MAG: hypothetical protein JWQ04_2973 [Pedosphaera sp.]|nr:hypothetical protein [Pedosphaera sp.]